MTTPEKYDKRAAATDSLLCVGLDSEISKIPEKFKALANPQFEFNKYIIEETNEFVAAYKPNSAFYESRGDQGMKELKMTCEYIRNHHPDIFIILDAKRADIGNTNNGYVEFAFDWLGADAITVNPYLGKEALAPFIARKDKCAIVLAKTSNPGSGEFLDLKVKGQDGQEMMLWEKVASTVAHDWNINNNLMIVVGATYPAEMKKARELSGDLTFLIPGIGAQGGDIQAVVEAGKNSVGRGMIINSSRGIIFANDPKEEARKLRDEIRKYQHADNKGSQAA